MLNISRHSIYPTNSTLSSDAIYITVPVPAEPGRGEAGAPTYPPTSCPDEGHVKGTGADKWSASHSSPGPSGKSSRFNHQRTKRGGRGECWTIEREGGEKEPRHFRIKRSPKKLPITQPGSSYPFLGLRLQVRWALGVWGSRMAGDQLPLVCMRFSRLAICLVPAATTTLRDQRCLAEEGRPVAVRGTYHDRAGRRGCQSRDRSRGVQHHRLERNS